MIRAALVLALLCATLSPSAAQIYRKEALRISFAGLRSEREARALAACETCSICAVNDEVERDRLSKR